MQYKPNDFVFYNNRRWVIKSIFSEAGKVYVVLKNPEVEIPAGNLLGMYYLQHVIAIAEVDSVSTKSTTDIKYRLKASRNEAGEIVIGVAINAKKGGRCVQFTKEVSA